MKQKTEIFLFSDREGDYTEFTDEPGSTCMQTDTFYAIVDKKMFEMKVSTLVLVYLMVWIRKKSDNICCGHF